MKAYRDVALHPSSQPLLADDLVEFHLARILLLLRLCGRGNRIAGLTKFAKLDFFVRYPDFFARANAGTATAASGCALAAGVAAGDGIGSGAD